MRAGVGDRLGELVGIEACIARCDRLPRVAGRREIVRVLAFIETATITLALFNRQRTHDYAINDAPSMAEDHGGAMHAHPEPPHSPSR